MKAFWILALSQALLGPLVHTARLAEVGQWDLAGRSGVSAMHAAVLPTNEVLFLERVQMSTEAIHPDGSPAFATLFRLSDHHFSVLSTPSNLFCSAGSFLPNGTLVNMGGATGKQGVPSGMNGLRYYTSCPKDGAPEMEGPCGDWVQDPRQTITTTRWYPTAETLEDGRIFLVGGSHQGTSINTPDIADLTFEIHPAHLSPSDSPDTLKLESHSLLFLEETLPYNLYPVVHLLPDGSLFLHANRQSILLNTTTWDVLRKLPSLPGPPRSYPLSGASILLPLRLQDAYAPSVLICGGSDKYSVNSKAEASCGRLNLSSPNATWEMDNMPMARMMPDMFSLADGSVLVLNGASTGVAGFYKARDPVFHPYIYAPDAPLGSRWTQMAPSLIPRMYHSVALLLPDARVLVAGSNPNLTPQPNATFPTEYRVELFTPPYLFTGHPRPVIHYAPTRIQYGQEFRLRAQGGGVAKETGDWKAALVQGGFVTHSTHMSHRWVELEITQVKENNEDIEEEEGGEIILRGPPRPSIAPRGQYMLFLLEKGVPSVAKWIKLEYGEEGA